MTTTTTRKGTAARIAGLLALLGVLAFIGWGLWLAYHPVPVPLQGQVEARTFNIAPKISARIATLPIFEGQDQTLFVVGDGGTVLKGDGATWTKVKSRTTRTLYSVYGVDTTTIFAVGEAGVALRYKP